MALPTSGAISLANVNTELGVASNTTRSLNDAAVRSLFGKASGVISMSDGYGKSSLWKGTISTHQQQMNLAAWATANGWNGSAAAEITIANGAYIYSDNTAVPALTIGGSWPGGLTLVNNGIIMGKGGKGYGGTTYQGAVPGESGGAALSLASGLTITINCQNGYIAGGGGGGAGSYFYYDSNQWSADPGGGGAGGGAGGAVGLGAYNAVGGAGGAPGSAGGNGAVVLVWDSDAGAAAGGGGRIIGGSGGLGGAPTYSGGSWGGPARAGQGGGAGGGGGFTFDYMSGAGSGNGGTGGTGNAVGGSASMSGSTGEACGGGGGGGGFGAAGGSAAASSNPYMRTGAAGVGGKAVNLNSASVTWLGGFPSSRVFGAVS